MSQTQTNDPGLSVDAFMAWYELQPDGKRFELMDGRVYEMQAERLVHSRIKLRIASSLQRQIEKLALKCEALVDGMAVRINDKTVYEPDVLVRCGPELPDETVLLLDPLIVVEVASPSTRTLDATRKLLRYFRNPHIMHYLIVSPEGRFAVHYRRKEDGVIESSVHEDGVISFAPLGLLLDLAEIFPGGEAAE